MKSADLDKPLKVFKGLKLCHLKENPRRQAGSLLMHSLDTHSQQGAAQALYRRNSFLLKWPRISHPSLELGR